MKKLLLTTLVAAALAGCAANDVFEEGRGMVEVGRVDEGLARIEEALKADPYDHEIRNFYLRNRALAVQRYLTMATTHATPAPWARRRAPTSRRCATIRTTHAPRRAWTRWRRTAPPWRPWRKPSAS